MKVLFFIDAINEDIREGEVVEYEGKIWLLAPLAGQIVKPDGGPARLIRLDCLPKFSENTPGHYILNTPIPTHVLLGRDGPKTTIVYEERTLLDTSVCIRERRFLN